MRDMPWGEIPPIPETRAGASPERKERRNAVWRSVITQQLQADELAVIDGRPAAEPRAAPRGEALLLDDGAGRVPSRRGVVEARRAGRRRRRARPVPRRAGEDDARGGDARGEGVPDAGLLRAADHPPLPPDRPLVARDAARGSLQPAHDRRRHPPQRRRRLRARPARGRVEEAEGPAGQGREPAAADLRRARALAAEGAGLDRRT